MRAEIARRRACIALLSLAAWTAPAPAQETGEDARETHRRALEADRRAHLLERSAAEEARGDLGKPSTRVRDAKLCENTRVYYQSTCGSTFVPRTRNPRCAEADALLRQNCG